jgi:hypothetical protein
MEIIATLERLLLLLEALTLDHDMTLRNHLTNEDKHTNSLLLFTAKDGLWLILLSASYMNWGFGVLGFWGL